jgi:hypothetical protein
MASLGLYALGSHRWKRSSTTAANNFWNLLLDAAYGVTASLALSSLPRDQFVPATILLPVLGFALDAILQFGFGIYTYWTGGKVRGQLE